VSLFIDSILRALPEPSPQDRVFIASGSANIAQELRAEGWLVVEQFSADLNNDNPLESAKNAACTHVWDGSKVVPLTDT
ncbi:MAG: hypothetical protein HON14_02460, partial [Rhodospirillaceae bacterium]|nr:hypothetical protein [Rhodospirillaceae bacterium]